MRKAEWKSVLGNPLTSVWLLAALVGSVVAVWTHNLGIAIGVLLVTAVLAYRIWSKAKWVEEESGLVYLVKPEEGQGDD